MGFVTNARAALTDKRIAIGYVRYGASKVLHSGAAVRSLPDGIKITGFSGFGEFYNCSDCLSRDERSFLSRLRLPAGEIIDVGANLGTVCLTLAKQHPLCNVHAFEPNPSTFEALRRNIALNNLGNVKAVPYAVCDHAGEVDFNAHPVNRATTSIARQALDGHVTRVPCTTLDEYVGRAAVGEVAVLKIDVEGYESLVLRGAEELLGKRRVRLVYYEVCPELTRAAGFDPALPTRMLKSYGYEVFRFGGRGGLVPAAVEDVKGVLLENWVAIAASAEVGIPARTIKCL